MITYVIIKLTSGEQVMAALEEDAPEFIEVSYPLIVKMTPITDGQRMHEQITAHPFCQFSSDRLYRLPKTCIMFYKELDEMMIPHYTKIVNSYEDKILVQRKPQKELDWDEPQNMTVEELRKRIDMLADIFGEQLDKETEEECYRTFVEGNDTKH